MLTEHYVASIHTPLKTAGIGSKDVSILFSELQPLSGVRQTFKKSATAPNCLAVSESHIFAAQAEKAVVHVYNRERGNHEATVPFNEKVTCLVLGLGRMVLFMGTEGGRILCWEFATGRLISTPQSHLQAVTCLAIDPTSNFLLSGSQDANVLVWSLNSILSFSSSDNSGQGDLSPIHSLSSQRGPITSLSIGHSHGRTNIAISASEDQSVIVWDYQKGIILRTYLLRGVPNFVVLDKSDRGFYTIYDDGSIQMVDFYADDISVNTLHDENITTPVQPGEKHVWKAEGQELGAGLCLALSWDGSRLLSGHKSGKIASWDVGKGSFMSIQDALPGSASSIVMMPVQGLLNKKQHTLRLTEVVKPRISSSDTRGIIPGDYALTGQLACRISTGPHKSGHSTRKSRFQDALTTSSIPSALLTAAIAELESCTSTGKPINGTGATNTTKELTDLKAHNQHLLDQIAHLQKLQKASFAQLREKNKALSLMVAEQERVAEMAKVEHGWNIVDANVEWAKFEERRKKAKESEVVDGDEVMEDG